MFGWFSQQIREHGIIVATRFAGRVALSRFRSHLANRLLPAKVLCPCCGWQGRQFFDYHEIGYTGLNASCPQCESQSRQRYLSVWLSQEFRLETRHGVALILAPERALASFWINTPTLRFYRVDIEATRGVDVLADMKHLPVKSNSIDVIWCHHVLEHIDDDGAAIRELQRVLRPGSGELVVSVPMISSATTVEYGFPDPMESGHWRVYGDDFETRLTDSGLTVQVVDFSLPVEDKRRYGLIPERFYLAKKTEHSADLIASTD